MLIEQIVEFELSEPRPPTRTCTLVLLLLVNFMTKQKFPRNIFEWIIL